MTRVLADDDVARLLSMPECIDAMRVAFRSQAEGHALNILRQRIHNEGAEAEPHFWLNVNAGSVPEMDVCALRVDATRRHPAGTNRELGRYVGDQYTGLVLLFSMATGELVAILHDFALSGIRVGATTAMVADLLARRDARTACVLGSGKLARTNLEGLCCVRRVERVRVFSPAEDHRRTFASEMTERLGCEVVPAASARQAVEGADIVLAATNSVSPVLDGAWLEPGVHVTSIVSGDRGHPRREVDDEAVRRADLVIANSIGQGINDNAGPVVAAAESGKAHEAAALVAGQAPGRSRDDQITLYLNNGGMGIQFAAGAAIVLRKAIAGNVGTMIDSRLFSVDVSAWAAQGLFPSP